MPNWCSNTITIWDDNKDELGKFAKLLDEWTSKDYMENGFGHNWLVNIVLGSGIGTVDTDAKTDVRCRGSLTYSEYDGNECLRIDTETAWSPMLDMWVKLQEKFLPNGNISFYSEEPGCELYATNEEDMVGKWVVDAWDQDDIESNWEADKDYVIEVLQKLLNSKETDVYKLQKMLWESDIEGIGVHEWEDANIEDYL